MANGVATQQPSIYGASPFELRVNQGKSVRDVDVRQALKTGEMGFLHSFTTGSAVDGPGIRLVAWTTSCMFRCQYCHNPDTWTLANGFAVTIEQATEELRKYATGLKRMGGGFTLSGGEPLMQHRFAVRLFAAAKELGIHTAIETNGYNGEQLTDEELALIDLVILDMKAFTRAQHKKVTGGMEVGRVIEFCRRLATLGRPMWLRYVLVPGLTDDPREMQLLAEFAASLGVVERAEILPFHQMGRYKWHKLGFEYTLEGTESPSPDEVSRAIAIFREAGLNAC